MKKPLIFHPLFFAIFPVISLYCHNQDLSNFTYAIRSLFFVFILTVLLFFSFRFFLKNHYKSAAITSLFVMLFFSFGHFLHLAIPYITISNKTILNIDYYILIIIWLTLFISLSSLIITSKKNLNSLTSYLNAVSIILVMLSVFNIFYYQFKNTKTTKITKAENYNFILNKNFNLPDIYYIILDGYARSDILDELYDYDNSLFIHQLEQLGFYVADKSIANYPQTYLSMSSALNFTYLDELSNSVGLNSDNREPLRSLLKNNKVYDLLQKADYKFVSLPFTWTGTYKNNKADIYINPSALYINEFENLLIDLTPLNIFFNKKALLNGQRNRIIFSFDHIPDIANINGPTFTYVHLLSPHPPFIFDKDGNAIASEGSGSGLDGDHYFKENPGVEKYRAKYADQLNFISKKVISMVDKIIQNSDNPPIIILQSDHGPGSTLKWESPEETYMKERMSILNAYYLPQEGKNILYNNISPVNSFRVIFNFLFKTNFALQEDKSYFATWSHPYKFIDVTNKVLLNKLD